MHPVEHTRDRGDTHAGANVRALCATLPGASAGAAFDLVAGPNPLLPSPLETSRHSASELSGRLAVGALRERGVRARSAWTCRMAYLIHNRSTPEGNTSCSAYR